MLWRKKLKPGSGVEKQKDKALDACAFFLCFYDIIYNKIYPTFSDFSSDLTLLFCNTKGVYACLCKVCSNIYSFCVVVFFVFKLYNSLWRFASIGELSRIFLASIVTTIFNLWV